MATVVKVELSEDGKHIEVRFSFDPVLMKKTQTVPGNRFKPRGKDPNPDEAYWRFPAEVTVARRLRDAYGNAMKLGPRISKWGWDRTKNEDILIDLALSESEELERLPLALPALYQAVHLGPLGRTLTAAQRKAALRQPPSFQSADVKFLARAANPLNGNHPGLGKTLEHIAAIFEEGRDEGSHLVMAPLSSLESVWQYELEKWQPYPVLIAPPGKLAREKILTQALKFHESGEPFWLVIGHNMAQLTGIYEYGVPDFTGKRRRILVDVEEPFPTLYSIEWSSTNVDEVHRAGFRNDSSLMARGISRIKSGKRVAMSGTPIGGKTINLWAILHYLNPDDFTSKWRFAEQWLGVDVSRVNLAGGGHRDVRSIRDLAEEKEQEFFRALTPYILRRTKAECIPWLPDKQFVELNVRMGTKQAAQYEQFAKAAEVRIEEEVLSATSILAEYTRLKQFAVSLNSIEYYEQDGEQKFKPIPTTDSCKLDMLEELLDERGFFETSGRQPTEQVVIFSQFSQVVDMVHTWLTKVKKVEALKLTGATNRRGQRKDIQDEFQSGKGQKIIVMTTTAGGVSINLDMADAVIFMDETWEPDDQEQAEDRIHRASRNHQVTVYRIYTKGTVEEYIKGMNIGKASVNRKILDLRRQGLRATRSQV